MDKYAVYTPRLVAQKDNFASGHRACIGCGEALAVKLACKALGNNVIVSNATGCMEIVASQIPYTTWHLPWIHTLFENAAAVARPAGRVGPPVVVGGASCAGAAGRAAGRGVAAGRAVAARRLGVGVCVSRAGGAHGARAVARGRLLGLHKRAGGALCQPGAHAVAGGRRGDNGVLVLGALRQRDADPVGLLCGRHRLRGWGEIM